MISDAARLSRRSVLSKIALRRVENLASAIISRWSQQPSSVTLSAKVRRPTFTAYPRCTCLPRYEGRVESASARGRAGSAAELGPH